ncbi:MAG: SHOCT domain-containing protein [Acidobacteria bacterium]|nr:SHOCT domain-containing protein [Acidobacteriota bacterium]
MPAPHATASLLLIAFAAGGLAQAAPPETRRHWQISSFSWVRRVPAEKGAPANGHPFRVEAAGVARALAALRLVGPPEEPLFDAAEVEALGRALSEALALASPEQDLELLSTEKRSGGPFRGSLGVTARAFVREGRLNFIVHDGRLDFVDQYFRDFQVPTFVYGSRSKASGVRLKAEEAETLRPDWLAIPLAEGLPKPDAAAPRLPAPSVPGPTIAPAPQTPRPSAPPPGPSLEERLQKLKGLRDKDLITEAEYQKKKQEMLKEL